MTHILLTLREDVDPKTTTFVLRYDPTPQWWSVQLAAFDERGRLVPLRELGHGYRVKVEVQDLERLTRTMVELLEPDGT